MEFKLLEVSKFTTYLINHRGGPIFIIQKSKYLSSILRDIYILKTIILKNT